MKYIIYIKGQFSTDTQIGASSIVVMDKELTQTLYSWAKGRKCKYDPENKNRAYEQEVGCVVKAVMSVPKGSTIELHSNNQTAVKVLKGEWEAKSYTDIINRFIEEKEKNHVDVDFRWDKKSPDDALFDMANKLCEEVAYEVRNSGKSEVIETENLCFQGLDSKDNDLFFKLP